MNDEASHPRRLRIAVLNRHFGHRFGGAERYAATVVEELSTRHDIHVFAQDIEHHWPGVTYHLISRPIAKPRWVNQLWFAVETWRQTRCGFDVVHSHENTWHGDVQTVHVRPFRAGLFQGRAGIRRFFRWMKLLTSPRLLAYWFLEASRFRVAPGKYIVASSGLLRPEVLSVYPAVVPDMLVIAPGVRLPSVPPDSGRARQVLALPKDALLALFVGNDYAKKGLGTLLAALVQVPKLELAIVGSAQQAEVFRRQAEQLGIAQRVHFLGSLQDVTPAYRAANLLVHPTTEDTYAMVVLEAMAYGLPAIVSGMPFCGIAADLTHDQNAVILQDPRDANVLAHELTRLLHSRELRAQLKFAGEQFASERSWQYVADQYQLLFLKVFNKSFALS